jgi:hypothetical protein
MVEVVPGVYDWSAYHEGIRSDVHSHFVAGSGTLIDPMDAPAELPAEPQRTVLTNRHHLRRSERYGVPILCNETGLHEFANGPEVRGYRVGDEPAPGIHAHEMGGICPDDTALLIDAGPGVLALADAVIRRADGALGFVPDSLWGDPEGDKAAVLASLERLLELDFDALLLAHGAPQSSGARDALRELLR